MKKLILILIAILLVVILTSCVTQKSLQINMYEVHMKNGNTANVCADEVNGVIDSGIRFYLKHSLVSMFSGDGVWFTSVPVESCE